MWSAQRTACFALGGLLFFVHCVSSYVIPDQFTSLLHLLYSKIPPIKKGTDSRFGVGFRLGQHADFQIILELGPQQYTDPIGINPDTKRKRTVNHNLENEFKLEIERYKLGFLKNKPKLKKTLQENEQVYNTGEKSDGSEWLLKWRQGFI